MPALHCSPQNLNTWLCKPENILASLLSVTFVLIVPLLRTSRQEIYNLLTPLSSGTSCCKLGKCMHNKKCIKKLPNLAWLCTAHRFVLPISWLVPYNALAFFFSFLSSRLQCEKSLGSTLHEMHQEIWCNIKLGFSKLIKFIYSEKASKFCEISTVGLTGTT